MSKESAPKRRALVLFDAQNVFKTAQSVFGNDRVQYPNFDPIELGKRLAAEVGATVENGCIRMYTGVPPANRARRLHLFWASKKLSILRRGGKFWESVLRYHEEDGAVRPREKGVDVRIALDILHAGLKDTFEVIIVASHDQDLAEAVADAQAAMRERKMKVDFYSAFPSIETREKVSWGGKHAFPIKGCQKLQITEAIYFACIDPRNHFPNT